MRRRHHERGLSGGGPDPASAAVLREIEGEERGSTEMKTRIESQRGEAERGRKERGIGDRRVRVNG